MISYTVFTDFYHNQTAVVKMRTIYITTPLFGSKCSPSLEEKRIQNYVGNYCDLLIPSWLGLSYIQA